MAERAVTAGPHVLRIHLDAPPAADACAALVFSDPSESLAVRPRWAWLCRPRTAGAPAVRPRLDANRSSPFAAARSRRAKTRSTRRGPRRSAGGWNDPARAPTRPGTLLL